MTFSKIKSIPFLFIFITALSNLSATAQVGKIEEGKASYYADYFEGRNCASGDKYRKNEISAAHKTLPFGTIVRVTHIKSGKSIDVRVNDRGPFVKGRIIDLSRKAAEELGLIPEGVAMVKVEIIALPGEVVPAAPDQTPNGLESTQNVLASAQLKTESPTVKLDLPTLLRDANLPAMEIPVTGFSLEIGRYHFLGNMRAMYLNLGGLANQPFYVRIAGADADGDVYAAMVGLTKSREEMEAWMHQPDFAFAEGQIVDLEKLAGTEPETGSSMIAP